MLGFVMTAGNSGETRDVEGPHLLKEVVQQPLHSQQETSQLFPTVHLRTNFHPISSSIWKNDKKKLISVKRFFDASPN